MNPDDLLLLVTRTMPFGKHKGKLIADLPGNYLNWFAREGFPPGDIGRLLALMQEIDHNGLKDIFAHLGTRDFWRLRIGIGHPGERADVVNYVLNAPRREEVELIEHAIQRALDVVPLIIEGKLEAAMLKLHSN